MCSDTQEVMAQPSVNKYNSAIMRHLKESPECRSAVYVDAMKRLKIMARGRCPNYQSILEVFMIA